MFKKFCDIQFVDFWLDHFQKTSGDQVTLYNEFYQNFSQHKNISFVI